MKQQNRRTCIQAAAALLTNGHLSGFWTGRIYQGPGKQFCVPGLNCYSCPGALGACPIGALQAVLGGRGKNISYYVTGLLLLFGTVFGRLICGFLCPFGLLQDLLHRIPSPKPRVPKRLDRALRWNKYVVLGALVIAAPLFVTDAYGIGAPAFCKYLCPAGTLEGGIPLLLHSATLRSAVGALFGWKLFVLIAVIAASVLLYRPFCKYLCPLGALYGLCNRFSLYQLQIDESRCTHCGACTRACPMQVEVPAKPDSPECIRCGLCREKCPEGAIRTGFCTEKSPSKKSNL